jgi:hypothetical protein
LAGCVLWRGTSDQGKYMYHTSFLIIIHYTYLCLGYVFSGDSCYELPRSNQKVNILIFLLCLCLQTVHIRGC